MAIEVLCVTSGAIAGALVRWQVSNFSKKYLGETYYGTLGVNVMGSFIMGSIWAKRTVVNDRIFLLITTGFCGSFTTMSSFSIETFLLLNKSLYSKAVGLVLFNNFASIGAAALGYKIVRSL